MCDVCVGLCVGERKTWRHHDWPQFVFVVVVSVAAGAALAASTTAAAVMFMATERARSPKLVWEIGRAGIFLVWSRWSGGPKYGKKWNEMEWMGRHGAEDILKDVVCVRARCIGVCVRLVGFAAVTAVSAYQQANKREREDEGKKQMMLS